MKQLKEFLTEGRIDEAPIGRSPFSNREIHSFLKNAGLTDMEFDSVVYAGYASKAKTHIFSVVWANEEDDHQTNDRGEPLIYAVNLLWVYLGESAKIEADVSPMPEEEELHVTTARKLAVPVAKKELRRLS